MSTDTMEPTAPVEPVAEVAETEPAADTTAADAPAATDSTATTEPAPATAASDTTEAQATPPATRVKTFGEIVEERFKWLANRRQQVIDATERWEKAKNYAKALKEDLDADRATFEKEFDDVMRLMQGDVDLPLFKDMNQPAVPKELTDMVALVRSAGRDDIDVLTVARWTASDCADVRRWVERTRERDRLLAASLDTEAATIVIPPIPKCLRRVGESVEEPAALKPGPKPADVVRGPFAGSSAPDIAIEEVTRTLPEPVELAMLVAKTGVWMRLPTPDEIAAWSNLDQVSAYRWATSEVAMDPPPVIQALITEAGPEPAPVPMTASEGDTLDGEDDDEPQPDGY